MKNNEGSIGNFRSTMRDENSSDSTPKLRLDDAQGREIGNGKVQQNPSTKLNNNRTYRHVAPLDTKIALPPSSPQGQLFFSGPNGWAQGHAL